MPRWEEILDSMIFSKKNGKRSTCVSVSEGVGVPKAIICTTRWSLTLKGYRVCHLSTGLYVLLRKRV